MRTPYFFDSFETLFDVMDKIVSSTECYHSSFPPVNVYMEKESGVTEIELALAGYDKEAISISFEGDHLLIKGDKLPAKDSEKYKTLKQGIKNSKFSLNYSLAPGKYDTANATAKFNNGILTITIPPAEGAKPIEVKIN